MNKYTKALFDTVEEKFCNIVKARMFLELDETADNITRFALEVSVFYEFSFAKCISSALMAHGRGVPPWKDLMIRLSDAFMAADESDAAKKELEFLVGLTLTKAGTEGILRSIFKSYLPDE